MGDRKSRDERRWIGPSAAHESETEPGRWVMWGTGAPPDVRQTLEPADDIARGIARAAEPDWDDETGWILIVTADETTVDEVAAGDDSIRGYAPYLSAGPQDEETQEPMRGVLRNDVAPRRKVEQPRPS